MSIKMRVKQLREDRYLTQRQMADILGITDSNLRNIENNYLKSISLSHIEIFCKTFECTPSDIFEITED